MYLAIVIVFAVAIVIFVVQDRSLATMLFLRAQLAILAAVVCVLGSITRGSLCALLHKSVRESQLTGAR